MKRPKLWSRFLAGLLCLCMVATSLSTGTVSVYAEDVEETAVTSTDENAVEETWGGDSEISATEADSEQISLTSVDYDESAETVDDDDMQTDSSGTDNGDTEAAAVETEAVTSEAEEDPYGFDALTQDESVSVTISEDGEVQWYSFTPSKSGTYRFASTGSYDTYVELYTDPEGEAIASDDDSGSSRNFQLDYALVAGQTYYVAAGMCYSYIHGTYSMSVSWSNYAIESITFVPGRQEFYYPIDYYYYQGISANITYTDGTTETLGYYNGTYSSYTRKYLSYSTDAEYDYRDGYGDVLAMGTWTVTLTYMTESYSYEIEVVDASEIASVITVDEAVTGDQGTSSYYKFTPSESGIYAFSLTYGYSSYHSLYYDVYNSNGNYVYSTYGDTYGRNYVYYNYNAYSLTAGMTYYISIGSDSSYAGETYSFTINQPKEISGSTSGTGAGYMVYSFVPEEDGAYSFTYSYSYNTDDEDVYTSMDMYLYDSNNNYISWTYDSSGYYTSTEYYYTRYYLTSKLTAGETYYVYVYNYSSSNVSWTFDFNNFAAQIASGETAEAIAGYREFPTYQYYASEDGVVSFDLGLAKTLSYYDEDEGYYEYDYSNIYVYDIYEVTSDSVLYASYNSSYYTDSDYYHNVYTLSVNAGSYYVVRLYSYGEDASYTIGVTEGKAISGISIKTLPTKTEYKVSDGSIDYSGLVIQIEYEDGTTEDLEYGSTSSLGIDMSFSYSGLYSYDELRQGDHEITVKYLGNTATFTVTVLPEEYEVTGTITPDEAVTETYDEYGYYYLSYFYQVEITESGLYSVSCSCTNGGGVVYIYDSNGEVVTAYSGNVYYLDADEDYVVKVRVEKYYYSSTLTVVTTLSKIATITFSDGVGEASGTITSSYTYTYYAFQADFTGEYDIRVTFGEYSGYYAYLYTPSGSSYYMSNSWDDDGNYYRYYNDIILTAGEWYIIEVYSSRSTECDYAVSVTSPNASSSSGTVEGATELEPGGGPYFVNIGEAGTVQWFTYTPEETGTYVIYSTYYYYDEDDYYGYDTCASLYSANDLSYSLYDDDDGGESLNFKISYTLQAGVTYYYATRMLSSYDTGYYWVYFEKVLGAKSIEITSYPQQEYYTLLHSDIDLYGLELLVTYEDDSTETVSYGSSTTYGQYISYSTPSGMYSNSGKLAAGEHIITVSLGGASTEYTITVYSQTDIDTVLEEGVSQSVTEDGDTYQYWKITPSSSGLYRIAMDIGGDYYTYSPSISVVDDSGNTKGTIISRNYDYYVYDDSSYSYYMGRDYFYNLTAGTTYIVVVKMSYWASNSSYTIMADAVTELTIDGGAETVTNTNRAVGMFTVSQTGLYKIACDADSSDYYTSSFYKVSSSGYSYVNSTYSGSISTSSGYEQYRYAYLEAGTYLTYTNYYYVQSACELSVESSEGSGIDLPYEFDLGESSSSSSDYSTYIITPSTSGTYTFTMKSTSSGSYYNRMYLYKGTSLGSAYVYNYYGSYEYDSALERYVYVYTLGVELTAGETYLLAVRNYYALSLTADESAGVNSIELIQNPSQTTYYYKLDNLTSSSDFTYGSALRVTYTDGTGETIYDGDRSYVTGFSYTITLPEDASYDKNGYVKAGTYYAVVSYMGKTTTVPITVKAVSSMVALEVDENGEGSYSGELENYSADGYDHYGYIRFRATADGFYNMTLTSDRYVYFDSIYNASYSSMSYTTSSSYTDSKYMYNASVYVKKGQSCYVRYYYYTDEDDVSSEFTFSVDMSADQTITALTLNEQVETSATSTSDVKWFSFTPSESGTYILTTQDITTYYSYLYLYSSPDESSSLTFAYRYSGCINGTNRKISYSLTAGTTYYYKLTEFTGTAKLTIVKSSSPVSIELVTEGEIYCSSLPGYIDNSFADLEFLITYADGTSETVPFGYYYNGSYGGRYTNLHGYQVGYATPSWEYDSNGYIVDQEYTVYFTCGNQTVSVPVTARSIQDLDTATSEFTATINSAKYNYYQFTPSTTGYYQFVVSADDEYAILDMFDQYMNEMDYDYGNTYYDNGVCYRVRVYALTEGEEYCLRIGNTSEYSLDITCTIEQLSPVSSLSILTYPRTSYYLGVDSSYSESGLSISVTYEDGTSETISYGSRSATTGLVFSTSLSGNDAGNTYLGSTGTKTIIVSYMGETASYTINVSDISDMPSMTTESACSGSTSSAEDYVYVRFVAEETGYYRVSLSSDDSVPSIAAMYNASYSSMNTAYATYDSDTHTRTLVAYMLAGKVYYMKGYLASNGVRAAGSYTASIEPLAEIEDGAVESGELSGYETALFQFTAQQTGYYRFTMDADTSVTMKLCNSAFGSVSTDMGTKNDRRYYIAKLQAGTVYNVVLSNEVSTSEEYMLYVSQMSDVESITVTQMPDKTQYYSLFENSIDASGLVISVTYSDGTSEEVTFGEKSSWGVLMTVDASAITTDADGHYTVGTWDLTVKYLEQTTTCEIEIVDFDVDTADVLEAETLTEVTVADGDSVFYVFTPSSTQTYSFYSRNGQSSGIYGYIYMEDGTLVQSAGGINATDFSMTADLTAGETYIVRVRNMSSESLTASIKLHDTSSYTEVTGVNISEQEIVFGDLTSTRILTAEVAPSDALDTSVTWSIDNTSVATISTDGTVTPVAEGTATVTVTTSDGGYTDTCTVIVDLDGPEITAVYPADNSILGPTVRTLYIYASDDNGVEKVIVEYKKSTETSYTTEQWSDKDEDSNHNAVIKATLSLDSFSDGDTIDVRLTAVDKAGNKSESVTRTYTVDKNAPEISGLAAAYNEDTLAVDLTWTGLMETDISSYAIYRKVAGADDSTYIYIGTVTGYVNLADYSYSDGTVDNTDASYTYKLMTLDKYGNTGSYTVDASTTYVNQAPEVALSAASTVISGQESSFDLSASTDDVSIAEYAIDFGDGTTETATTAADAIFTHTYTLGEDELEASYTVTATVTDGEGLAGTLTKTIKVVNLDSAGMLTVTVVDEDGIPMSNVPVYFNMGEDEQVITYTNRVGQAEFVDVAGTYTVGAYASDYLPVKAYVTLETGDTATLTLTLEEGELVTGTFETHEMTLDEIKEVEEATGATLLEDEDSYHVIQYNATLIYGTDPTTVNVYYNGTTTVTSGGRSGYSYTATVVSPEVIVIIEVPIAASILKEFYDVKLYIMNNASEEFSLNENYVTLNVPDGLTVISDAYNDAEVYIDSIPGQSTEVIEWVLRGDVAGEYTLSADYTGVLSDFNIPVSGHFEADDTIKVYGVENLEITLQIPDSFTDGTFYYNLIMANTGDAGDNEADMYLPGLNGEGELVQTLLNKEDGTLEYLTAMPDVLHASESIERFYLITDQISEQLAAYPNYEDFVLYFKEAYVKELTEYGITLNIEVLDADVLAAKYEQYRALPATDVTLTVDTTEAVYGNSQAATITASATAATNGTYSLVYEWYDTNYDLVGTGTTFTLPSGLDAGTYHYHCVVVSTRTDNGNMAQTEYYDVDVTIGAKEVGLTWSGTDSREYDGTESNVTVELTGIESGDVCTVTVTGGNGKDAGEYIATASGLSNSNYVLPDDATVTYTITQKEVTLSWSGTDERTYDGTASNVTATAGGLVDGDTCTVTVTDGTATAAGTHTATASSLSNDNYKLPSESTVDYTIAKRTVTLTWSGTDERTYDGTASNVTATAGNLVDGDSCEVSVTGGTATNAGTYTATASSIGNDNYQLPSDASVSYTIDKRTAELSWSGTTARDYDGTASNVTATVSNLADGDSCEVSVTGGTETNAGTYTATASSLDNENYVLPSDASVSYTINKRTVTLTWSGADARTYDGTASSVTATAGNLVSGETCTVTVAGGTETNAGTYTATASSLSNSNYQLPSETTATYTINQREVTLTWSDTTARIYDGTASNITATAGNLVDGDECAVKVTGGTAKDAGTHTAEATALSNSNYVLPSKTTATYTINQREVTLAWSDTAARIYDGTASNITATAGNLVSGDSCTVTVTGGAEKDAGSYTAEATGLSNSNYVLPENVTVGYVIEQRTAELTWSGNAERTYDGNASNVTATVSNLADGDTCTVTVMGGTSTDAGSYTATATELSNSNYALPDDVTAEYIIEKLTAVLAWSGTADREYDGTASNVTATVSNLASGDTCNVDVTGGTGENVGTYTATATSLSNENYVLPSNASTTYSIGKRTVTLVWSGTSSRTYDGTASNVTATVGNLVDGQECTVTVSGGTETNAGTYTATAIALSNSEYYALPSDTSVTYTIAKRTVTLTWNGTTARTYDGTASNVTATAGNLVSGDTCTVTVTGGTSTNAGSYTATATGLSNSNYALPATVTATYVINNASITGYTATLSASSYTYDGTAKTPSVTLKNGSATIASSNYTLSYSNYTKAGTATVTITGKGNYTGTITKTYTIAKATQTVTVSATSVSVNMGGTTSISASTNGDGTVTYSSSNTNVATVSSSGAITPTGAGTATITVYATEGTNYSKSASKTITVNVGLDTPAIGSVSNVTSGIKVTWKQVTGASGYYIYRATSANGTYTMVGTVTSGSTLTFTNKTSGTNKISKNKTYYYKVAAYSGSTTSSQSSATSAIKYLVASVKSLTNTSKGITVKWSKVTGASGYYVYRKTSSGSYKKIKTITSGKTVSYSDTAVKSKNGTTYTYKVVPYYKNGSKKVSGTYSKTVKTVRLTGVTISSVKNTSSKKMTVKWKKNSKGTGYQIQYSMSSSFSNSKTVTITKKATTSKVISGLKKGKKYYVRIRVYKKSGSTKYYSAWSSKKSVKIAK